MHFLGVIGRHMNKSGLGELWVGCALLGANAAQHFMAERGYVRVIRTHKLHYRLFVKHSFRGVIRTWMGTFRYLHIHRRRLHCTEGWQTDYRQISAPHKRARCSSYSWWAQYWILVELYDYRQHHTLLHKSAMWWIIGSPPICVQMYAAISLRLLSC